MNRTLIGALDAINNLLSLGIIIAAVAAGAITAHESGGSGIVGAGLGLIVGLIVAAVVCGLLATLIEIEKNLRQLVTLHTSNNSTTAVRQ